MSRIKVLFSGVMVLAASVVQPLQAAPQCPQPRFTGLAPADVLARVNPLPDTRKTLREGKRLYRGKTLEGVNCTLCHGKRGDGLGPLATRFDPPPRNFRCAETVNGIADGQLFWIIRNGSPGTGMPAHAQPGDEEIWTLVHYLRQLATD